MNIMISSIVSIFIVTMINIFLSRSSKHIRNKIRWQHYLFGYFFILYLVISLKLVGFPSLSEWQILLQLNKPIFNPHINLMPFKVGFEFTDILNIVLFIPFGFLLPALWTRYRKLLWTVCYGAIFSLTIEISQLFVSSRETDINDLIMNILGTMCGFVFFNIMRKIFYKLANRTAVNICSKDTLGIKLEPYLYVIIAIICTFCFGSI
ncbi:MULTISPECIES: VanZ family protein [Clostridium]|uniref:VanZ family protein n=1 Tax=Clostridium TaxID=1485 RepID=UPI0008266646|nr:MULTISPECIES: VanZ family protein [Clostridium]PJI08690.1 VanZ family protein [Clostridium sp. CT7]